MRNRDTALLGGGRVAAAVLVAASLTFGFATPSYARPPADSEPPRGAGAQAQTAGEPVAALSAKLAALESAMDILRRDYDARLTALEAQLAALGAAAGAATPASAPSAVGDRDDPSTNLSDAERAELEREMAALLGEEGGEDAGQASTEPTAGGQRFTSRTRTLNQLNPEVSVTGDVFGTVADRTGDPESNQFRFAEFEMAFQSPLDPYSLAKAFVVQEDGAFEVEEAYIDWTSLPGGVGLKVGQLRHDWGKLNRWHQHALPQSDRPLAHQAVFGAEGLKGLGVSVSYLPRPFLGDYNEFIVQMTNDDNDVAFSGRGFDEPVFLLHETNYWDLSSATYLEVGVSGSTGVNDELGRFRTQVYGVDWNLDWRPAASALYRGLEVRGELLWERREEETGRLNTLGAYTYGSYKLNRRWFVGARADWTELPHDPERDLWGVSPYVEWWQSEWARLRFQYSHNSGRLEEAESENRFFGQVTWAIGPHKHEKY